MPGPASSPLPTRVCQVGTRRQRAMSPGKRRSKARVCGEEKRGLRGRVHGEEGRAANLMTSEAIKERSAGEHAEDAARHASPWVEGIARFGYAAKGVVYVVMGVLAVLAAVNAGGGSTTDQNGAFQTIEEAPFGQVLLGVVTVGLMGYVLWRSIQAVADPDGEGLDPKGVAKRIGYAGSALLHAFFAFTVANLAAGAGGDWGASAEE